MIEKSLKILILVPLPTVQGSVVEPRGFMGDSPTHFSENKLMKIRENLEYG